ncbi:DsbA family protein [Schaalia vaccimaxillae]|uniref:DsbA family protein n=1 Tax=Schaalia vaccimaxillae TaxID=183916 RepID=UPI00042A4918|nr:thioredoxin domain-containing protein [Schaalia vaccimaxillae]
MAIIAVLVLAIGFLVADRGRLQAELLAAQSASTPATQQTSESEQAAPAGGTASQATDDPEVLNLIREQIRRDPSDGQAMGDVDAKVVMVLYSDFSCPVCTHFAHNVGPELTDLVEDGTLRIEWRDLAQITQTSPLAAQAGIAAAEQGKFWEFHDIVYAAADPNDHPEYTNELLMTYAQQAQIPDLDKFQATMTSQQTVTRVEESKQYAHSIGIQGTPFMIIGDAVISGLTQNAVADIRATIMEQASNPDAA